MLPVLQILLKQSKKNHKDAKGFIYIFVFSFVCRISGIVPLWFINSIIFHFLLILIAIQI